MRLPDNKFGELVEALPSIGMLLWAVVRVGISLAIMALVVWGGLVWLWETFVAPNV